MIYDIRSLLGEKTASFNLRSESLLSFCDCLSLIRNEIGLIAWGVEDLFALCGEGTTTFYSATAETAEDAIKMLKKSVHIPTHNANVFFIMVAPEEKCNTKCFEDFPANIGLHEIDCDIYRQIYIIENTMFRGPVTYLGKISHKKRTLSFSIRV